MKIPKNEILILGLALFIMIIVAAVAGITNIGLQSQLSELEIELDSTKNSLQENVTKLQEETEDFPNKELFINTYMTGIGTYYKAISIEETASDFYDKAEERYDIGNWFSAVGYYDDAMESYNNAGVKYKEAQNIFKNASNYTTNQTFKNISNIYSNMMNTKSTSMVYLHEASEYMSTACDNYLDGDYGEANNNVKKAEDKIDLSKEQKDLRDTYLLDLNKILLGLS